MAAGALESGLNTAVKAAPLMVAPRSIIKCFEAACSKKSLSADFFFALFLVRGEKSMVSRATFPILSRDASFNLENRRTPSKIAVFLKNYGCK